MAGPGLDSQMRNLSLGGGGVGGGGGGGGPSLVRYVSQVTTGRPQHLLQMTASPGPSLTNGRAASRADSR